MQAITTKYLGPTNFQGARVKATAQAGSVTVPWDHALGPYDNHDRAAKALAVKLGWITKNGRWESEWVGGALPSSSGYAFVDSSYVPLRVPARKTT